MRRVLGLVTVPEAFTVEVDVDVPPFLGSSTPLETVVRNLVANAVTHNDRPDGRITIRARAVDGRCRIEVIDDGPGVPASAQKRIFRLFQTASLQPGGNAGVGLAAQHRRVRLAGRADGDGVARRKFLEIGSCRTCVRLVEWGL